MKSKTLISSNGRKLKIKKATALDKRSTGEKIFLWILCGLFAIYTISLLYPIYWALINSLKTPRDFFSNFYGLPKEVVWINYAKIFEVEYRGTSIAGMYLNSFIVTTLAMVLCLLMSSLSGYILSKYKFPGSRFIYTFAVLLLMVPSVANIPATYRFLDSVNLYDTHLGVALLYCGAFGPPFLYIYNFYESLSWTYAESAMMDGADDFQVFFLIMFPQSIGLLLAITLMSYMSIWGDYTNQMLYMKNHPTITVGIKLMTDNLQNKGDWPTSFAVMLFSGLPIGIIYIICNRLMFNISIDTGIKG